MSREVEKAGRNLLYKLSPKDGVFYNFKPNINDFNDLKTILEWYNRQSTLSLKNHSLFAKLFIHELTMKIREHETTVLNPFPLEKISNLLKKPLNLFYDAFYKDLMYNQLNKLVEFDRINKQIEEDILKAEEDYPLYDDIIPKEEYIKNKKSQIITEEQKMQILKDYTRLKETFTFDFVVDKLNSNIVEAINKFN